MVCVITVMAAGRQVKEDILLALSDALSALNSRSGTA
jgi:hypothetical protein